MVFWTMAYILGNPEIHKALRKDVENIPLTSDGTCMTCT